MHHRGIQMYLTYQRHSSCLLASDGVWLQGWYGITDNGTAKRSRWAGYWP
jgi:hypothetical protein